MIVELLGMLSFFDVGRLLKFDIAGVIFAMLFDMVNVYVRVLLRHVHVQNVRVVLHICLVKNIMCRNYVSVLPNFFAFHPVIYCSRRRH